MGKKPEHCDPEGPADARRGDYWDHLALDAPNRLILTVVPGARVAEDVEAVVADVRRRAGGATMDLITSDEHRPYKEAVLRTYGVEATPAPTGRPVRAPRTEAPPGLRYATVHEVRRPGRVLRVVTRLIFGTAALLARALAASAVSHAVNVSSLERQHLTDRHRDARKRRRTYCFSKAREAHEAATYFSLYSSNFCRPVRALRTRAEGGPRQKCTPALAAGLTDHVWSLAEWLRFPAVKLE